MSYRGRYAPSPTGPLHLGNAFSAYVAWKRAASGAFFLRIEDLDGPRSVAGMAEEHAQDLQWLGLRWDEPPMVQSQRLPVYTQALETLLARGQAYYCTCSRKTLAAVASAPHGQEPPPYPGTCRGRTEKPDGRYSVRFMVRPGVVSFVDGLRGAFSQDVATEVGDFVIARADGVFAYQLAVVVDDIAMGITEVVRGGDLLASTPRQMLLYEAMQTPPPAYAHTPLVVAGAGKLSKREPSHTLRGCGLSPDALRRAFDRFVNSSQPSVSVEKLLED